MDLSSDFAKIVDANARPKPVRPSRVLVYGMQSSGASWVTWTLAQDPDTIAVIDLLSREQAPTPMDFPPDSQVILKATVNLEHPLEEHIERFQPDWVIMVLRDEKANRRSLKRKRYGVHAGAKFGLLHEYYDKPELFDEVIIYEEWLEKYGETVMHRSLRDIVLHARSMSMWCLKGNHTPRSWGLGNIHLGEDDDYGQKAREAMTAAKKVRREQIAARKARRDRKRARHEA